MVERGESTRDCAPTPLAVLIVLACASVLASSNPVHPSIPQRPPSPSASPVDGTGVNGPALTEAPTRDTREFSCSKWLGESSPVPIVLNDGPDDLTFGRNMGLNADTGGNELQPGRHCNSLPTQFNGNACTELLHTTHNKLAHNTPR